MNLLGQIGPTPACCAFGHNEAGYSRNLNVSCALNPQVQDTRWKMLTMENMLASFEHTVEPPLVETFVNAMQECRRHKDLKHAKRMQMHVFNYGIEMLEEPGNYLVSVLVECGGLSDAQQLFYKLVHRNEFSWTSLIQGYSDFGDCLYALDLYQKMLDECVNPSKFTFLTLVKVCTLLNSRETDQEMHNLIACKGFERDLTIGNKLVDMYAKCGLLLEAQAVFDQLESRDVVSWTALISGYAENGLDEEALICLEEMELEGLSPNIVTYVCSLKSCGNLGTIDKGRELHIGIASEGHENELMVGNSLVGMYAKCDYLAEAQEVLEELPVRDVVSWNIIMTGYIEHGLCEEALLCSEQMQLEGMFLDEVSYICILKACGYLQDIDKGRKTHNKLVERGFERHHYVNNTVVDMYAKCASLVEAQELFNKSPVQDVVLWNVVVLGHAEHGLAEHALACLEVMKLECVPLNSVTLTCGLKVCASLEAIDRGRLLHVDIAKEGLEKEISVGFSLVDMYAKCGFLAEAQEVFNDLQVRDASTWNALIAGYAEQGYAEEALSTLERMQSEGVLMGTIALVCSLQACASLGAIDKARELHDDIVKQGFDRDSVVLGSLVHVYVKCCSIDEARNIFDELPAQEIHSQITLLSAYTKGGLLAEALELFKKLPKDNVAVWTILMTGYTENGRCKEALDCFEQMQLEGVYPDAVAYASILKACGSIGAIHRGRYVHAMIVTDGFEADISVGNTLIDMYAKCGSLLEAEDVFEELPVQNVVSWTALISGYSEHGLCESALDCLESMQSESVLPNDVTYVCSLKACSTLRDIHSGQRLHAEILKDGYEREGLVGSSLVDMYAKCGAFHEAWEVFDDEGDRNVVSWTALIGGYAEHDFCEQALHCLQRMQLEGISPNTVTFTCILKACSSVGDVNKGRMVHNDLIKEGFEQDPIVGSTLVDMYAKSGLFLEAWDVFDHPQLRNVVSWTALIDAYTEHGRGEVAFECLKQMLAEGFHPNPVTFVCLLKACASIGALDRGREIHAEIIKEGFDGEPPVGGMLVVMYAKCESLEEAHDVFDELIVQDAIPWTALIAGYAEHGLSEEGLTCLEQMLVEGMPGDCVSLISSLKACINIGALDKGRALHSEVMARGLDKDLVIGENLVNLYARCGSLQEAQDAFSKLPVRGLVAWNSLISGFARQGETEHVFECLEGMQQEGIQPNRLTFLNVLTACSHAGLIDKGQQFFEAMCKEYGFAPSLKHHNCMVDILTRAGQLDEALSNLAKMPYQPDLVTWKTMLSACHKLGNLEFGEKLFDCAVTLDEKHPASFILMSNIYSDV